MQFIRLSRTDAERINVSTSTRQLSRTAPPGVKPTSNANWNRINVWILVRSSLQAVPQEQLLPIVLDLTHDTCPNNSGLVFSAFELWCKNWQASCNAEILHRAGDPATTLNKT